MKRFKKSDMVYCPVCSGTGFIDRKGDETGVEATSCPHGKFIAYSVFLEIRLPHEYAKAVPKHLIID